MVAHDQPVETLSRADRKAQSIAAARARGDLELIPFLEQVFERSREEDRAHKVAEALAAGHLEEAEERRVAAYDDELSAEAIAEIARDSAAAMKRGDFITQEEWDRRMDTLFPEDAEFFRQLDERFPGWDEFSNGRNADTPAGRALHQQIAREMPEALFMIEVWK